MRAAQVRPDGTTIRWVELPGAEPPRVYVHGLGASSAPYYAEAAVHPALAGFRSLLLSDSASATVRPTPPTPSTSTPTCWRRR